MPRYKLTDKGKAALSSPQPGQYAGGFSYSDDFNTPEQWGEIVRQQEEALAASMLQGAENTPQYGANGIPLDWDWETAVTGPFGEILPDGALGWGPDNKPNFGEGWMGHLKQMRYKFWRKEPHEETDVNLVSSPKAQAYRQRMSELTKQTFSQEPTFDIAANYIVTSLKESIAYGFDRISDLWSGTEDAGIPVVSEVAKLGTASLSTLGWGAMQLEKWWKEEVQGPALLASDEVVQSYYARQGKPVPEWHEYMRNVGAEDTALGGVAGVGTAIRTVGTPWATVLPMLHGLALVATGDVSVEEYGDAWERNKDAARMAATAWLDPALKEEYIRRVNAGSDPRLLAMELQDPGAELAWGLWFDPLNLITGGLHKVDKLLQARGAFKTFGVAAPGIANASDAYRAAVLEGDAARVATEGAQAVQDVMNGTRAAGVELAAKRGPLVRTAGGKRTVILGRSQIYTGGLVGSIGHRPDDLFDAIKAHVLMASPDDLAEVGEGLRILNRVMDETGLKISMLASPAANETAVLLRGLLTDNAGKLDFGLIPRLVSESGGDAAKLAESLGEHLNGTLAKMYPNIQEQVVQNTKYLELLDESPEQAAKYLAQNPIADVPVSRFDQALNAVHETLQTKFYRPTGAVQGTLFMSSSPVYRMKNRIGNFVPTLVDQGPKAAFKGLFGITPQGAYDEIRKYLGGVLNPGSKRGIGAAGSGPIDVTQQGILGRFNQSTLAAADEVKQAAHISATSIRKTMRNALQEGRAIPEMAESLSQLSEAGRGILLNRLKTNGGDIDDALDAVRQAARGGYASARDLAFLDDAQVARLQDLRIYDDAISRVRNATTQEEALAAIDDIYDQYRAAGHAAAREPVIYDITTESGRAAAEASHAIEENLGRGTADIFDRRVHANRAATGAYAEAADEIEKSARHAINNKAIEDALRQGRTVDEGLRAAEEVMDGVTTNVRQRIATLEDDAFRQSDEFNKATWDLSDASKNRPRNDPWLRQAWQERALGEIPENLSASGFRDALWNDYRKVQDGRFIGLREETVALQRERAVGLAGVSGVGLDTPKMQNAEAALGQSRLFDRAQLAPDGTSFVELSGMEVIDDLDARLLQEQNRLNALTNTDPAQGPVRVIGEGKENAFKNLLKEAQKPLSDTEVLLYKTRGERALAITDEATKTIVNEGAQRFGMEPAEFLDNLIASAPDAEVSRLSQEVARLKAENAPFEQIARAEQALADATPEVVGEAIAPAARVPDFRMDLVGPADDAVPSPARFMHETSPAVREALDEVKDGLRQNWDDRQLVDISPEAERQLAEYGKEARGRIAQARTTASAIADDTRDFILHNYGDRYGLDLAASYIWPYQFWHSRTYAKWMKRFLTRPAILANYARYKEKMETQNAGLPEWWKYNINVGEYLGLDPEHPMYFNLEASLNPLNGLMGVDFTDPDRRLDWYSATLEDLNKFGPSVWMPYQLLLALKYHAEGQDEAASKWAGRLWGPTQAVRDVTALLDPKGLGVEIDPFVNFFGGGIPPYEEPRIGRQLSAMVEEGKYSEADIIDATVSREGPIWDEAHARAINVRAPNVASALAPYFLGAGFRYRTKEDIEIDRFYNEMFGLITQKPNLSPQEYREAWNDLERKYPFMDTLLLSKKSGIKRDEALAWNVLDRIPPGQSDEIAELVGISPEVIRNFHESKGDLANMSDAERLQFVGAIMEIGALLDLPDQATKAEWDAASALYSAMRELGEEIYGDDIWDREDNYFGARDPDNPDVSRAILEADPELSAAMDFKQQIIQTTPLLGAYYTSAERIRSFYKREMYDVAGELFGEDLWDHFEVWGTLKDMGETKAARKYWKDHPQMSGYMQFKEDELPLIEQKVDKFGRMIPEARAAQFRDGLPGEQGLPDAPPPTRDAWVDSQVLAYATGNPQSFKPFDIEKFIRDQADAMWPGTRTMADKFYEMDDSEKAGEMLRGSSALSARIAWEWENLTRLEMAKEGRIATAALSPAEWIGMIGQPTYNLIMDIRLGDELPEVVQRKLDALGITAEQVLQ